MRKIVSIFAAVAIWTAGAEAQVLQTVTRMEGEPSGQVRVAQYGAGSAGQGGRAVQFVDGAEVSALCAELAKPDFLSGAKVDVRVEQGAVAAVRYADLVERASVMTYTVNLYRDNSQNARENTYAVAEQFREMYPDIKVEVSYESPWFRVSAGRFVDRTDAVALCGRVLPQFKKAVVSQSEMSLRQIIENERTTQANSAAQVTENEE